MFQLALVCCILCGLMCLYLTDRLLFAYSSEQMGTQAETERGGGHEAGYYHAERRA